MNFRTKKQLSEKNFALYGLKIETTIRKVERVETILKKSEMSDINLKLLFDLYDLNREIRKPNLVNLRINTLNLKFQSRKS